MTEKVGNPLGYHISKGRSWRNSIESAISEHAITAIQIFVAGPQRYGVNLGDYDVAEISELVKKHKLTLVVHGAYVASLTLLRSKKLIREELAICDKLGALCYVAHLPKDVTHEETVLKNLKAFDVGKFKTPIFFEPVAGSEYCDGVILSSFLKKVRGDVDKSSIHKNVGYVIDTAHSYLSGYSITKAYFEKMKKHCGKKFIIHLNDTDKPFGSGKDHHTWIGDTIFKKEENLIKYILKDVDAMCVIMELHSDEDIKKSYKYIEKTR